MLPIEFSTAEHGRNKFLYLYHNGQIIGSLGCPDPDFLAVELRRLADKLTTRSAAEVGIIHQDAQQELWQRRLDPRTLTPAQVIAYFQQSPTLAAMADDIRAALGPLVVESVEGEIVNPDVEKCRPHREQLVDPDGSPCWGAQSRIAEILSIQNGGGHRSRILSVLRALQNSTSSTPYEAAPALKAA